MLVRHASAGNKDDWRAAGHHDDLKRPLDDEGLRQRQQLALLLQCYATGQVLSSLAERCIGTVQAYAEATGQGVQADPSLTVGLAGAGDARRRVDGILGSGLPAVLCGHRENLSLILEEAYVVLGTKVTENVRRCRWAVSGSCARRVERAGLPGRASPGRRLTR